VKQDNECIGSQFDNAAFDYYAAEFLGDSWASPENYEKTAYKLTQFFESIRKRDDEMPDDSESGEFDMRMLQLFIVSVYSGQPVPDWINRALADVFYKILCGGEWSEEICIPWIRPPAIRTKVEGRGLEIYCFVENLLRESRDDIVATISSAANEFHVSYETARADYYKWKKQLKPAKLLK